MRNSSVNKMNRLVLVADSKRHVKPQIGRLTHLKGYQFAVHFRANNSGRRFERYFVGRVRDFPGKTGEATGPLPAPPRLAAVAVVVTHPKISAVGCRFDQ